MMSSTSSISGQMRDLRCCVIIPTYNNDRTLEPVIREVEEFTDDIIVVNDGSTDETSGILLKFPAIRVITIEKNKGKGNALREGFKAARSRGFRYAITLDSDGQHFAKDIPAFLPMVSRHPDSLIVGARNMKQEGIPGGSSFGHRFSIFWFKVETGMNLSDVQSGFRLYPLDKILDIRFYSMKYEFEVEVLVRAAWKGVRIFSVPVSVYYAPKGEQVSHFRKFRDFGRTALLNTILVFWAILWVKPLTLARLLKEKSWKEFFNEYILNSRDSNFKMAASVALGSFFSALPIWGWQMVAALTAAYALKLNRLLTLIFSNLSIPPFMPVMIFLSYITGGWIMGKSMSGVHYDSGITLKWIEQNLIQYLVGSMVFSVILGVGLGILSYLLLILFRKRKPAVTAA